jgi:hypothetical protein
MIVRWTSLKPLLVRMPLLRAHPLDDEAGHEGEPFHGPLLCSLHGPLYVTEVLCLRLVAVILASTSTDT